MFAFFIASTGAFLLFHTQYWKAPAIILINRILKNRIGIRFTAAQLNGSLFNHLQFKELKLITPYNTTVFSLNSMEISYDFISFLSGKPQISGLYIEGVEIDYPGDIDTLKSLLKSEADAASFSVPEIGIRDLTLNIDDGSITRSIHTDLLHADLFLGQDSINILSDTASFASDNFSEPVYSSGINLSILKDSIVIHQGQLNYSNIDLQFSGHLITEPFKGLINLHSGQIFLAQAIPTLKGLFYTRDFIEMDGTLNLNGFDALAYDFTYMGKFRERAINQGIVQGTLAGDRIQVDELGFRTNHETIRGQIWGSFKQGLAGELMVKQVDLQAWNILATSTKLNGELAFETQGGLSEFSGMDLAVNLQDGRFETMDFDRIKGQLTYDQGLVSIPDTFYCNLGASALKLIGEANLNTNQIDLKGYLQSGDVHIFSTFLKVDTLFGRLDAFVKATGDLQEPDLRGWIKGDQLGLPLVQFARSDIRFGVIQQGQERIGEILLAAEQGKVKFLEQPIPELTIDIRFEGDTTVIRSFNMSGENMRINASAEIVQDQTIIIDDFTAQVDNNLLRSYDVVKIEMEGDSLFLEQTKFTLNQGILEMQGQFDGRNVTETKINMRNVMLSPLNLFIPKAYHIEGVVNADLHYLYRHDKPQVSLTLGVREIQFQDQLFSQLHLKADYHDSVLTFEQAALREHTGGSLELSGALYHRFDFKDPVWEPVGQDSFHTSVRLRDFNLTTLNRYLRIPQQIDGFLSGSLSLNNYLNDLHGNFVLSVSEPIYDKLSGDTLFTQGSYQENKLILTDLFLKEGSDEYSGAGHLPLELDLAHGQFCFNQELPLNMRFMAHTKRLPFITRYNQEMEELSGDFDIALSVSGTMRNPIRNGNMNIKNGVIDISSLENLITGVEGSGIMSNNQLELVSLTGFMQPNQSAGELRSFPQKLNRIFRSLFTDAEKTQGAPNVHVEGTLDFTEFFNPGYNLTLKGDHIYLRTLLAEEEGVLDAELAVLGQDTIDIEGDVEVSEFVIRSEFTGKEDLIGAESSSDTHVRKNLHVIAPGNLYFRNSQLDCELEGEIWLIQNGQEPWRYSGDLNVRRGSFYYYGWEFTDLTGSIIFDPTEFNPQLDIQARLNLTSYVPANTSESISTEEEEIVAVRLTGDLEKPVLQFESDQYTQSDILRILSRTGTSGGMTLDESSISSGALNIFGSYFERQLERRISEISGLDEFQLRTQGDLFSNQQPGDWSILLGQKVSSNLYITYERNFSLVEPNQQVGLQYYLDRNTSLEGRIDENGLFHINYKIRHNY